MTLARRLLLTGLGAGGVEMPIPDVRQYLTTPAQGNGTGGLTTFTAMEDAGNSLYARVIKSTPGLLSWHRLGLPLTTWDSHTTEPPYYANAAGAATLWTPGGSGVASGATLVSGGAGSADLTGGYLEALDVRVMSPGLEWLSAEMWVQFDTLQADVGLMGEWKSNDGWLLYTLTGSDLVLFAGDASFSAAGVLTTGTPLHIVGTWGGQQGPTPDYYSKLYVNGTEVASALTVITNGKSTNNSGTRFEIGQYADGGGTALDGRVQDVAVYSRMLQPDEIFQHYQAGLGVLWP